MVQMLILRHNIVIEFTDYLKEPTHLLHKWNSNVE